MRQGWGRKLDAAIYSLLQGISSEPSPQSSTPLHHSMLDTQRPLLHWRKVFLQRRESVRGRWAWKVCMVTAGVGRGCSPPNPLP